MKNVLKKGIAFTLALTLSVSSANVSLFITKANQQAEEKSNVKSTTVYNNKNEIVSQSFVDYDGRTVKELSMDCILIILMMRLEEFLVNILTEQIKIIRQEYTMVSL